jgi:F-type H+-transporting ATPase subunit b
MISLNIDFPVFAIQILSFVLLMVALQRLLFEPVSKVLAEREQRTKGVRLEAGRLEQSVADSAAEYDRKMQEVRRTIAGEVDSERARTSESEHAIRSAAHSEAEAKLAAERQVIQGQIATARTAVEGRAQDLADLMVERVTGRKFA